MKTGRKISITYSTLTIAMVTAACVLFYLGTRRYTTTLYYRYLEQKARVIAMERYGQDDLEPERYQHAIHEAADAIPTTEELFVPMDSVLLVLPGLIDSVKIAELLRGEVVYFSRGSMVGAALLYYDNSGTYATVVLSRNPYGDEIAHTMRWMLLVLVLGSSVVLWLVSRLWASRMVNRIDQKYQTERLFVGNAQHEINNPLTVIRGECEVALLRTRTSDEYIKSLERIDFQAERIEKIMRQLLALGEARQREECSERISIAQWLEEAHFPPHRREVIANFKVQIDPTVLYMAVNNLINNAVKYGEGEPRVEVERPYLRVISRGNPISYEEINHIFDPFYRGSNAIGTEGHGIGLSIAKTILKQSGAILTVRREAEYTIFTIRFH